VPEIILTQEKRIGKTSPPPPGEPGDSPANNKENANIEVQRTKFEIF